LEGKFTTINARKFDGSIHRTWTAKLVESKGSLLVFLGEFDREVTHPDLGVIRRGTLSYEYYWLDRWYNVFRFHEPNDDFRNFYCNINMPPSFEGDTLDYVDLDIDILVSKDSDIQLLDQEEYEENSNFYGYSPEIQNRVAKSISELRNMIRLNQFPFEFK